MPGRIVKCTRSAPHVIDGCRRASSRSPRRALSSAGCRIKTFGSKPAGRSRDHPITDEPQTDALRPAPGSLRERRRCARYPSIASTGRIGRAAQMNWSGSGAHWPLACGLLSSRRLAQQLYKCRVLVEFLELVHSAAVDQTGAHRKSGIAWRVFRANWEGRNSQRSQALGTSRSPESCHVQWSGLIA